MTTQLRVLSPNPKSVLDFSTLSTTDRCPRKTYYQYILNRAPVGENYPIGWGIAYHKFREDLERLFRESQADPSNDTEMEVLFDLAWQPVGEAYVEPPSEHRKGWMTTHRLRATCIEGFTKFRREKILGRVKVIQEECAFDLKLPFDLDCACVRSGVWTPDSPCPICNDTGIVNRYGGRFDQIIIDKSRIWVRDFKTKSRRPKMADFEPHHQFTGYVWAARELSGRDVEGVWVETVYNTKTIGPEIKPFLSTRTDFHIEEWLGYVRAAYDDYLTFVATGWWPQRTTSCDDYGGCFFRDACTRDGWPQIEDWLLDKTIESIWDFTNPDEEKGVPV